MTEITTKDLKAMRKVLDSFLDCEDLVSRADFDRALEPFKSLISEVVLTIWDWDKNCEAQAGAITDGTITLIDGSSFSIRNTGDGDPSFDEWFWE